MRAGEVKSVCAVGLSCADVYEDLDKSYPTGNGVDWGVHLARMGVPVSGVSVVGTDEYGIMLCERDLSRGLTSVTCASREATAV